MREITYAQAIKEAMTEEMRANENVFLMGKMSACMAVRSVFQWECLKSSAKSALGIRRFQRL